MLIPFRSKAAGDFFMFDHHVRPLFSLMGQAYTPQGALSGAQAAVCAAALSVALDAPQNADPSTAEIEPTVGLKQRAWPLLDMLRRAASKNVDVVWGSAV